MWDPLDKLEIGELIKGSFTKNHWASHKPIWMKKRINKRNNNCVEPQIKKKRKTKKWNNRRWNKLDPMDIHLEAEICKRLEEEEEEEEKYVEVE